MLSCGAVAGPPCRSEGVEGKQAIPWISFASAQAVAQGPSVLEASQEFRLSRLGELHRLTQVRSVSIRECKLTRVQQGEQRIAGGFLVSLQFGAIVTSPLAVAGYHCLRSMGVWLHPVVGEDFAYSKSPGGERPLALLTVLSPAMAEGDTSCGDCRASSSRDWLVFSLQRASELR